MTLTNRDLKFRFYSVLKNEDAPPFITDTLLAVADGLGGSGSTVHKIDYAKYPDFRGEIMNSAFGDMSDEGKAMLAWYFSEIIAPMADNIGDTSALWASRIALARFVYALGTDRRFSPEGLRFPEVRAELSDFVKKGLISVAERFGFESGKISGQILLPTTLTAIRSKEYENSVRAEVMWVGDSRAYAFTKDGMKLLSVDDEDESGCITNIFDGREGKRARINYRVYQIPKPCLLMTASDGVFDPFSPNDNLGVENLFLSVMSKVNSAVDMARALSGIYSKIHADDASVCLKAFGFSDFDEIKSLFSERAEYISVVAEKLDKMRSTLDVMDTDEADVCSYISQRSEDKYAKICEILLEKQRSGVSDIILDNGMIKRELDKYKVLCESAEKTDLNDTKDAYGKLYTALLDSPEKLDKILIDKGGDERECILIGRTVKRAYALLKAEEEYEIKQKTYNEHLEERKALRSEIAHLIELFNKKIDEIAESADKSSFADCKSACEKCLALNYRRRFWQKLLIQFDFERIVEKTVKLSQEEIRLFSAVNSNTRVLILKRHDVFTKGNLYNANKSLYETELSRLIGYIKEFKKAEVFFAPHVASELIGAKDTKSEKNAESVSDLFEEFLLGDPYTVVNCILQTLAEKCNETSAIDSCYNATRLENFRQYYRNKGNDNGDAKMFLEELRLLEERYMSAKPFV